jgi:hypothetical protein
MAMGLRKGGDRSGEVGGCPDWDGCTGQIIVKRFQMASNSYEATRGSRLARTHHVAAD